MFNSQRETLDEMTTISAHQRGLPCFTSAVNNDYESSDIQQFNELQQEDLTSLN